MKSRVSPKIRAWIFLFILNAAWISLAGLGFERETWLWITPIALSINCLFLTYDQVLNFSHLHTQRLSGQDPWGILKLVHQLSTDLQRPPPQVFLIPLPCAQLFSYGKTGKHSRLFITEGTLQLLNEKELRAVLTYQILAMKSSYSVLNYWLGAVLDLLYRLGRVLQQGFAFIFGWAPNLSAWLVSPWIWLLHYILLSPKDFQKLDKATAARLQSPEDLARALWKMDAYAKTQPWPEPWVFAHMCMVSPFNHPTFRIQPSLKGRIKHLLGRYQL